MRMYLSTFMLLLINILFFTPPSWSEPQTKSCPKALAECLSNQPTRTLDVIIAGTDPAIIDRALLSLYIKNKMQPLWMKSNNGLTPKPKASALLQVIQQANLEGLHPEDYKISEIKKLWPLQDGSSRARLDVLLTMALGRYVSDMREGSADPRLLDPKIFAAARDKKVDILKIVNDALQSDNLSIFLNEQAPRHAAYQGLRKALVRFRAIDARGGWQRIPTGKVIKPGMHDSRLPLIAKRLLVTGELQKQPANSQVYGPIFVAAVKKFQHLFHLEPDGIIGTSTLTALNRPASQLVRQIILNMERWRWLPHRLNGKHIFVNIAGFHLFGATDERMEINMPVIVGKVYHETPVFTGQIRYVEVNPYWNIPNSIAENEMVPHMQKDPDYLRKNRIRIFKGWDENAPEIDPVTIDWNSIGPNIKRYRLRQDPGPTNALGRIKFIFPNKNNIYLHDTPAHQLFTKTNRSFSHGCIRVSRPFELGAYLLQGNKKPLSAEQLRTIVDTNERTVILLDTTLPVHILYRTVQASTKNGEVHFYPDIYGRDSLLEKALFTTQRR